MFRNQKTIIWLVLLLALPSLLMAQEEGKKKEKEKLPEVPWLTYHEALATGKAESKPILLHFTADWNVGNKDMLRKTYGDYKVAAYLQKNFANGWVDVEQQTAIGEKYEVDALPTLIFLDSNTKLLTRVDGALGPEKMMLVLEYINTKAYGKMPYEKWKEKRLEH